MWKYILAWLPMIPIAIATACAETCMPGASGKLGTSDLDRHSDCLSASTSGS